MSDYLSGTPDQLLEDLESRFHTLMGNQRKEPFLDLIRGLVKVGALGFLFLGAIVIFLGLSALALTRGTEWKILASAVVPLPIGLALGKLSLYLDEAGTSADSAAGDLRSLGRHIGFCRKLSQDHANIRLGLVLDPAEASIEGHGDSGQWRVEIVPEVLGTGVIRVQELVTEYRDSRGQNYSGLGDDDDDDDDDRVAHTRLQETTKRFSRRQMVIRCRVPGDVVPAGHPGGQLQLMKLDRLKDTTVAHLALPQGFSDQRGTGFEGRRDYVGKDGINHPEFEGEQMALALVWMSPGA